ncbi:hypothetical protein HYC85_003638 [Camellia sinensis]|uniref:Nuclear pore complex protein NUP43 n=1 Tax=Camellia sinensis TaxID=4442 RepID=A0A7J7HU86_CAMSI|nr:hypothetical protein HYC85_003638 [Camellia sinensis]
MAVNGTPETLQVHRLPLSKYIDALRWLPPLSAFDRFVVLAVFDTDSNSPAIEIHSLTRSNPSNLTLQSSWSSPSRISSLKVSQTLHKPLIAASTCSGSLHVLLADPVDASIESEVSVPEKTLHVGPISCIDVQENGSQCVSVGEDGRVNLVSVGNSNLSHRPFFDSNGLVSYTAAKWASPMEFATGGLGFGLQWWDQRKPGGPASQFKGNWAHGTTFGIVHSIDIHPSRKHACIVLPVMICSEDGILAVVEQGEEAIELLAEPCAINSFDIDRQNPSDVMCSLEWEAIAILMRA